MRRVCEPRFTPGRVLLTPGAKAALVEAGSPTTDLLARHISGDWGEMDREDQQTNERGLKEGSMLMSSYTLETGVKIWIISDAIWDGDPRFRRVTTLLLPEEY